ncbi:MAG: hypothetical protein ACLFOY_00770 [Desulfatibacillaceae bacterium]
MKRCTTIAACVLLVLAGVSLAAPGPAPLEVTLFYKLAYFACGDPLESECRTLTRVGMADCDQCGTWLPGYWSATVSARFDPMAYSYDTGLERPRANHFLRDVTERIYNTEYPGGPDMPATIADMYANHEKYGWITLSDRSSMVGSIALLPQIGGLVLGEWTREDGNGRVYEILYPSHRKRGELSTTMLHFLGEPQKAVFVLPGDFLENGVGRQ